MNLVILALIAALQKEVFLLEQELNAQTSTVQIAAPTVYVPQYQAPVPPPYVPPVQQPVLGVVATTTPTSTPDAVIGWECINENGFYSFGVGSDPSCPGNEKLHLEYQSATTTYYD